MRNRKTNMCDKELSYKSELVYQMEDSEIIIQQDHPLKEITVTIKIDGELKDAFVKFFSTLKNRGHVLRLFVENFLFRTPSKRVHKKMKRTTSQIMEEFEYGERMEKHYRNFKCNKNLFFRMFVQNVKEKKSEV